jgi:hypothetical protein
MSDQKSAVTLIPPAVRTQGEFPAMHQDFLDKLVALSVENENADNEILEAVRSGVNMKRRAAEQVRSMNVQWARDLENNFKG